jgi:uncharacterized protein (TIGR02271 family)
MSDHANTTTPGQPSRSPALPARIEVTRFEEQLRVSTRSVPSERVRLERYIVTEQRTITLDVKREEIRLIREPLSEEEGDATAHSDPQDHTREDIIMVLREEQPVITKKIVPVERVCLHTHTVTELHHIDEAIGREQIDIVDTTDNDTSDHQTQRHGGAHHRREAELGQ